MFKIISIRSFSRAAALVTAAFIATPVAFAYIPSSQTIVGRLVRTHGKGIYVIDQDVVFQTTTEPITIRERWIVKNGEDLRLTASTAKGSSAQVRYDAFYKNGKRTAPDFQGNFRTGPVSREFIEIFPHTRTSRGFLNALVDAKIVPASFLKDRPRPSQVSQIKYTPDPLVRLGRTAGAITWIFGEPTPASSSNPKPAVWIEQDAFLLRRVRFPSAAEVISKKHGEFSGSLSFPRERIVTWDNSSALIRTVSVKPMSAAQADKFLSPSSLTKADAQAAQFPDQIQVKEFYSRFR